MQKKLIALAVAGLVSAPVFAQSNVTLYGVADAAVGAGKADDNDFRGVVGGVLSGNRFGLKGSEDLGNGLKAVFQLEQGFNVDDGTFHQSTRQFSRQAWVGLQGSFGTVSLGRQYAPGYFAGYDAALQSIISPQSLLSAGAGLSITPNSPARWNNSIAYTGSFSGLTTRVIYAASDSELSGAGATADPVADDQFGAGVDYSNGPVKVGVVYQQQRQADDTQKEWLLGAQYDFGVLTVAGTYQIGRDVTSVAGGDRDNRLWNLGVIVPVSAAGNVHLSYGALKEKDLNDADAKSWMLAYTHALSKRTTAYVGYNKVSNDNATRFGAGAVVTPAVAGEDSNLFVAGMRHTF